MHEVRPYGHIWQTNQGVGDLGELCGIFPYIYIYIIIYIYIYTNTRSTTRKGAGIFNRHIYIYKYIYIYIYMCVYIPCHKKPRVPWSNPSWLEIKKRFQLTFWPRFYLFQELQNMVAFGSRCAFGPRHCIVKPTVPSKVPALLKVPALPSVPWGDLRGLFVLPCSRFPPSHPCPGVTCKVYSCTLYAATIDLFRAFFPPTP